MEWINASDRLPQTSALCIVSYEHNYQESTCVDSAWFDVKDSVFYDGRGNPMNNPERDGLVTYWMPMPKPA